MLGGRALTRHADSIGTRTRQFVTGARDIQLADIAFLEAALDQLQRVLAQRHGTAVQILIRVELAQLEVVLRDVGLQRQLHRPEQRFTLLLVRTRRIHVRTDPPEQIGLVRSAHLRAPDRARRAARAIRLELRGRRRPFARRAEARVELREPVRLRRLRHRTRLLHTRRSRLQVLIRGSRLLFQRVELRVAENRPPFAAMRVVGGLGLLPACPCPAAMRRR